MPPKNAPGGSKSKRIRAKSGEAVPTLDGVTVTAGEPEESEKPKRAGRSKKAEKAEVTKPEPEKANTAKRRGRLAAVTTVSTATNRTTCGKRKAVETDQETEAEEAPPKRKKAMPKTNGKRKAADTDGDTEVEEAPPKRKVAIPKVSGKRKAVKTDDETEVEEGPAKKKPATKAASAASKTTVKAAGPTVAKRKPKAVPTKKALPKINSAPTQKLNIYVCGEGTSGELGLGSEKKGTEVKRPRLNPNLAADRVGVVQLAAGGMHVAALTHDNKILTWGVNDQGALGRDTTWEGKLKDADKAAAEDSDTESEASDTGMNPYESSPAAVDPKHFPEGTVFTQVAAGDSTTFALTDEGLVFGWGTFRSNEGIFGFSKDSMVQRTPMLIPGLKQIVQLACGENHVLAPDNMGNVFAWGSGQQNQLGRRVVERTKTEGLTPREFGLPKRQIKFVECGAFHSFAIDNEDNVWTWGLNNYGETGIDQNAGESDAVVLKPQKVTALEGYKIKTIKGGSHHSIAVTVEGDCLVWGRFDGCQTGIKVGNLPVDDDEVVRKDERGTPRILIRPTKVSIPPTAFATCGADHSLAITKEGQAYSWGFNATYQCGQGSDGDVEEATLIDNTAVRGKKLTWAGAGGQYSIFAGPADEENSMVNGTSS